MKSRRALTLVELLVVIVILTTLVGGVIPVLSPNNDSRKIRAASRGLQGYITQIQAKAARTGRPHGIAFRETDVNSGVAIEVFGLEVPPSFAGFSTASQARIMRERQGNGPNYNLYVQFVLADTHDPTELPPDEDYVFDPIPPNFVRPFDRIEIGGVAYQFIDSIFPFDRNINVDQDTGFYLSVARLRVIRVGEENSVSEPVYALAKGYPIDLANPNQPIYQMDNQLTAPKPYKIIRQPANSTEAPYQLPASIAIDLQGSVLENAAFDVAARLPINFPLMGGRHTRNFAVPISTATLVDRDLEVNDIDTIGIMFSPTGAVSEIYHNNRLVTGTSRVVLLLGRIENGGLTYTLQDPGRPSSRVTDGDWVVDTNADKDELDELRERINWLNLESRFLSIVTNSGRAIVSEPAFVDLTLPAIQGADADVQFAEQLERAHEFVHDMTSVGGN